MSDILMQCDGCGQPEYDCQCCNGGWTGETLTRDGVKVTGSNIVFWMYAARDPERSKYYPCGKYSAHKVNGTHREPMSEMFSSIKKALEALEKVG